MFVPKVNERLKLGTETYYFTEHPALKGTGMPYGQTGRKATVFQLRAEDGKKRALKVFSSAYRSEENMYKTGELLRYSSLPGLATCERFVISKHQFPSLIQQNRDLDYSVLMPWVEGITWQDLILKKQTLSKDKCYKTALELNRVLGTMESSKVAHCDLSGPNLILSLNGHGGSDKEPISLIDLEEMYAPDLTQPKNLPAGSAGYAHCTASKGLWCPEADRFAGSILLANILAWSDPAVVDATFGENYFSPDEMHTYCPRYQALTSSLARTWGKPKADLFEAAWNSKELRDCPSFADWANEFHLNIEEIILPDSQPDLEPFKPEAPKPGWNQREKPILPEINKIGPVTGYRPLFSQKPDSGQTSTQPAPDYSSTQSHKPQLVQDRVAKTKPSTIISEASDYFSELSKLSNWSEKFDPEKGVGKQKPENATEQQKLNSSADSDLKILLISLGIIILIILFIIWGNGGFY